ncbi:hypothetical protein SAMN05421578_107257 [Paenibacillus macquariensis]|uniref:Uncharacterized protein n=1 Tax=Paenibacillus macquariensis TaxID=948756 RepID=A0ABY1K208_9BACL|nr:hypothetical protein SAMN05421578_107257 [Paenibacillus macquariensis]
MRQSSKQCSSQVLPMITVGHFNEILQSDRASKCVSYPMWAVCPKGNHRDDIPRL